MLKYARDVPGDFETPSEAISRDFRRGTERLVCNTVESDPLKDINFNIGGELVERIKQRMGPDAQLRA